MPPGRASHAKAEARKALFLSLLAGGRSKADAMAEMALPRGSYVRWRADDKDFAARVDAACGGNPRNRSSRVTKAWSGDIIAGRKAFFGFDSHYHHVKIIQAIDETPPMGITLILLPPEHGKTTVISDIISLRIGQNKNLRVGYVSEGLGLARKALRRQKNRMTLMNQAPAYIAAFGPFHEEGSPQPWTADYIVVDGADHDEQDYSFEARGWKSAIAGSRIDDMVLDDIQSRKSLSQTTEMLEMIRQDFISRVGKTGRIIIVGTRVGEDDIYQALMDQGIVTKVVMLPATVVGDEVVCEEVQRRTAELLAGRRLDELDAEAAADVGIAAAGACAQANGGLEPCFADGTPIPHETPLCPQMWNAHQLAVRRSQVGEVAWWRNYQQNPRRAGDSTFTEDHLVGCRDLYRVVGERTLPGAVLCLSGLDPSLTGGNAFVVADGNFQTLQLLDCEIRYGLARTEAILDRVAELHRKYRFRELVVEVNAFQKGLGNDERLRALSRTEDFVIRPHTTGINKLDEDWGPAGMARSFTLSEIRVPYGDQHSRDVFTPLLNQLGNWRPLVATRKIRQDLVMALWFAWLTWMQRRKSMIDEVLSTFTPSTGALTGRRGSPFGAGGQAELRALVLPGRR